MNEIRKIYGVLDIEKEYIFYYLNLKEINYN